MIEEPKVPSFIDNLVEFRSFLSLIAITLTITVFSHSIWIIMLPKVYRLFKPNRTSTEQQSQEKVPGVHAPPRKFSSPLSTIIESETSRMDRKPFRGDGAMTDQQQISRFVDDIDAVPVRQSDSRPAPHWLDGPRDSTTLPDIIASTYSDYNEEADYAMKQMLAILETLNPIDEYLELFEKSLTAIEFRLPFTMVYGENGKPNWKECRDKLMADTNVGEDGNRGLSTAQITSVFDALPFLFDTVACYEQLEKFQDALSMLVMIAMAGNALIRRQCISAVSILMERNLLSQEFMRDGVLPGLFFIYQSGVGTFQSNDLRMECVQALCQIISYDTIHDRKWLFENFLPRFSQMLKDPTMHVRKSALHIFGNLGNMFGQKFTEVFLVPHLITLSCDMTWAVRKVACEIFVKVAECASKEVRVSILSPNFVRLLNDPNKWVSFIAYQQLGPFIALFANPEITGLELINGQVVYRDVEEALEKSVDTGNTTFTADSESDEYGDLPPDTWLPEVDYNEDFEYKLAMNEIIPPRPQTEAVSAIVKTPKRGERVMDSVISGINKMFSPFERNSPKSNAPKEIEKISATFSSPSKRSPLSLHSAVSLMDKWSKRSNPNNPQRFPIFNSATGSSSDQKSDEESAGQSEVSGIAAKCNSTDDLTKLGLDDDVSSANRTTTASSQKCADPSSSSDSRTSSPRGRRIATNAWSKLDIRQKLFLRRLGALPPSSPRRASPKLTSPTRSPTRSGRKKKGLVFDFSAPTEIRSTSLFTPPAVVEEDELNTVEREQYMETSSPKFNDENGNDSDSDEEDSLDKSFVNDEEEEEDTPLTMEIQSSKSRSVSVSVHTATQEPISNEFSLTYWSSNYAIASIDDELKPFGSSSAFTNSPTSNSYLESRFDVMKTNTSPRARSSSFGSNGSPFTVSPRSDRKSNSASESPPKTADSSDSANSVVMINTEEKEMLGILDIDEMDMDLSSNSSIHGEAAMTEESDISLVSIEHSAFQHVPVDLVESYMKVMGPIGHSSGVIATGDSSLCAEVYRHCAHNFPAVCYTLGRAAWPRLKLVFRKLALDEQSRVRQSISYSIHEIANMLGTDITDEDLLPVFYDLRNDQNADVRGGILMHLYDFVKCLSPAKRDEMIFSLPQFFPIGAQPGNQAQNGDWRSRFELISQLSKLCSLYSIQDINLHMSGIALTLADDRVAEVRREAVMLVSTIVGALVSAEWEQIVKTRDVDNGHVDGKSKKEKAQGFLSEQFVDDIVSSFAKTQKWTRRQTFCFICAQVLRDKQCDGIQFRYFFATPLQHLVQDKVPNVRLTSCEALTMWRKTLIAIRAQEKRGKSPLSSPASEPSSLRRDINLVSDMMVKLANDSDIDAAFIAKKCQGLTDDQQPVDVEARTNRMREREELFFGDIILTDSNGSVVRMARKELKQIIKRGPALAEELKVLEEKVEKDAPIQTFDEFEEEIMIEAHVHAINAPPEMVAVAVNIPNLEDNTEEVDMEIDEVEETAPTHPAPVTKTAEEEVDIPMDPSPSDKEKSTTQPSTSSTTTENDSEA